MLSLNHITETFLDFPDGESLSVIVFFNGCIHNCPGCQNPELQISNNEALYAVDDLLDIIIKRCNRNKTNKIVLSGGDPFYDPESIIDLIDKLENKGFNVCAYTGYTIDKIKDFYKIYNERHNKNFLGPSYLKCGVYAENLRDNTMGKHNDKFILASANQAFYARILKENTQEYTQISKGHILYFNDLN